MPREYCTLVDDDDDDKIGLLLIPGMAQQSLTKLASHCQQREIFETKAIRKARRKGQPILGVCAGSWRVWQIMGEQYEKDADGQWIANNVHTAESVTDHMATKMAYLLDSGQGVESNVMVHVVNISHSTILADAMGFSWDVSTKQTKVVDMKIPVNSIHWQSPKYTKHSVLRTSATAVVGEHGAKLRTGKIMVPQESTVEAFESKYGAPILGVQWHFEAFYDNPIPQPSADAHLNILRFMAKAGDSYCQKRAVVKEIAEINRS